MSSTSCFGPALSSSHSSVRSALSFRAHRLTHLSRNSRNSVIRCALFSKGSLVPSKEQLLLLSRQSLRLWLVIAGVSRFIQGRIWLKHLARPWAGMTIALKLSLPANYFQEIAAAIKHLRLCVLPPSTSEAAYFYQDRTICEFISS